MCTQIISPNIIAMGKESEKREEARELCFNFGVKI
jgi:hypothetical protein